MVMAMAKVVEKKVIRSRIFCMLLKSIDIHNHILPEVDDGFRSERDSLLAIQRMAEGGCREIVFTPHMNPDVYPGMSEDMFSEVYNRLVSHISPDLNLTTHLAAEYMIVPGFEDRVAYRADSLLTYPDSSILVEMSYYYLSPNLEQTIFELNMAGLKPVLAHPERYTYLSDSLDVFDRLYSMGCRFQLNYMSLTGKYGPHSMKILKYLLKNGMYGFVATDLHSLSQLDSIMSFKPGFLMERRLRRCLG